MPLFPLLVEPPYAGRGRPPSAQRDVLRHLRTSADAVTVAALAALSARSRAGVRRCLRALARAGLVRAAEGRGRARVWGRTGL